jgi:hypothetical protein
LFGCADVGDADDLADEFQFGIEGEGFPICVEVMLEGMEGVLTFLCENVVFVDVEVVVDDNVLLYK